MVFDIQKIRDSASIIKTVVMVVDKHIAKGITAFFESKGYFSQYNMPPFAAKIPFIFRMVFYLMALLVFLAPLKIVFPDSKIRSLVTYMTFGLIIAGIFAIFFGFFQLMYNF